MSTKRIILVVDDDEDLRSSLVEQLDMHNEFGTIDANSAVAAVKEMKDNHVDLVLLDVGLPDMDGREVCKIMRSDGYKGPIIMLTGHDSEADEILGLQSGASDYVTKPFRFGALSGAHQGAIASA